MQNKERNYINAFLRAPDLGVDFHRSAIQKSRASGEKVSATTSIGTAVKNGLAALRRLRAIVQNKYTNNPAKLAAWASASHVERPAKKKSPPATP